MQMNNHKKFEMKVYWTKTWKIDKKILSSTKFYNNLKMINHKMLLENIRNNKNY
jgi:hypothetical protein